MKDAAPSQGHMTDGIHRIAMRVYYEDTDAGGIVYYANYLKFAERARTEALRCFGLDHEWLKREHGVGLAVRRCTVEYIQPAKLDDVIVISTRILSAAGATLELAQEIARDGSPITTLALTVACLGENGRPHRLPPALAASAETIVRPVLTRLRANAG